MHQKKTRKTVAVALVTLMAVTMLGLAPSMAHAGALLCAIAATGGILGAIGSLFVPGAILGTGPIILEATALACVAPTP